MGQHQTAGDSYPHPRARTVRSATLLLAAALLAHPAAGAARAGEVPAEAAARARAVVQLSGAPGGVCVHLGAADGAMTAALSSGGRFVVQGLAPDAAAVEAARRKIEALDLYGAVTVDRARPGRLPYSDNLVNMAVVDGAAAASPGTDYGEVFRVLAPGGTVCAAGAADPGLAARLTAAGFAGVRSADGWTAARKPRPAGMDDWKHAKYDPAGTGTSHDVLAGPPRSLRWVYAPQINQSHGGGGSSIAAAVSANGRLYQIIDHSPPFMAVPSDHRLTARDAFNGVPLWEKPVLVRGLRGRGGTSLNRGLRRPGRAVAVSGDTLYTLLDSDGSLLALDGRTGQVIREYKGISPDATIVLGERLLLLDRGRVLMVNEQTGAELWKAEVGGYDNSIFHGDGRVFCHATRAGKLVCLDDASGRELWALPGHSGTVQGCIRDTLVSLKGNQLVGLAVKDGSQKWTHTYRKSGRAGPVWPARFSKGLVWVYDVGGSGDGDDGNDDGDGKGKAGDAKGGGSKAASQPAAWVALDPETGKVVRTWPSSFADKCAPPRATDRYLIPARLVFTDTESGENIHTGAARGACGFGALPANGMIYTFPTDCRCRSYLNGTMGFGPETGLSDKTAGPDGPDERVEKGPAFGGLTGPAPAERDWPVYRADPERRGATKSAPPAKPERLWSRELGGTPSPPTVADGRVFVAAVDRHQVHALDAKDGKPLWSFTAGGRVTAPPACGRGAAVFGSRDGWVYCLRAADGALAWRYRAAPAARAVVAQGQLESAWPVEGGLMIVDGRVYGSAGRHTGLGGGIAVFALDLATGRPVWEASPVNATFADMLVREGDWAFMQRSQFGLADGKPPASRYHKVGDPAFRAGQVSAFRQTSYAPRAQWQLAGTGLSPLMAFDAQRAVGVQVFDDAKTSVFRPADKGYLLWLKQRGQSQPAWQTRTPVQPLGMLLTPERVYAAGPEDVWPRKGARMCVYATADGKELHAMELPAPPVFDGLISAGDRLYLATLDGKLSCYGK